MYHFFKGKSSVPDFDFNEGIDKPMDKLRRPWMFPTPTPYAFTNGIIIDSLNGTTIQGKTVLIKDGIVQDLVSTKSFKNDKNEYNVVDVKGKFLSPGLFDFHVHLISVQGEKDLRSSLRLPKETMLLRIGAHSRAMLERGFTSIRDCAGMEHYMADSIEDNIILGPRAFFCGGALSQTGGHADLREKSLPSEAFESCECHISNLGIIVDGVPACLKAARENFRRGGSFIKIMAGGGVASPNDKIENLQFTDDETKAIVEVAECYGSFVTAHAYTPKAIQRCIKNGVKGIEHGNLIDEETAQMMAENEITLTPTLVSYKVMASDRYKHFLPPESQVKNLEVLTKGLESLLIAKKHGVRMCFGSDLLSDLTGYQSNEFSIRSKVLTPAEILKSATVTPAEVMKAGDKIGQISKGFYADILILNENPLKDITILDKPDKHLLSVIKNGLVYYTNWDGVKSDVPTSMIH